MAAGADPDPRIVPFRGAYLRLVPERRHLVRSLIYPVPDPSLPFLGVHLTKHIDGEVLVGPTALMAGARDAYRLRTVRGPRPARHPRLAGHLADARPLVGDGHHGASPCRAALGLRAGGRPVRARAARGRRPALLRRGARAGARSRRPLVDDFVFSHTERALHVRNAPSPAATSSLAIARHVADEAERVLGVG